ncbi:MAG TPA: helix-turn-helix domain-containing protein [Micromonosporaceae bacterium]
MIRRRDAEATRQALLDAARSRFARDGYAASTVRDIAADAGANVSLIGRYFTSKEGLFEACLESAGRSVSQASGTVLTLSDVADAISRDATGITPGAPPADSLLLLLRSSGDEQAERIRVGVLRTYSERIAGLAGWTDGVPDRDHLLLRAQVVLAAALGLAVLRTTTGMEPLASADASSLAAPVTDLVSALLSPHR